MTILNVAQIIISVVLILAVLMQTSSGGLSSVFGGGGGSAFRTRRGIERTLFRFTIALVVAFIIVSMVSVRIG